MDPQIVQAAFMLGFVAMAAGAFYFFMERGELKPEYRSVATYAAVIAFIAAIMYYVMKDTVLFPGGMIPVTEINATMPLRYIDWLITTPLLLIEFGLIVALAGGAKAGLVTRLVVADLIMIARVTSVKLACPVRQVTMSSSSFPRSLGFTSLCR